MSQNITVTCFRSPSILSLCARIFWVRSLGRYLWILASFSSKESSLGIGFEGRPKSWPHSPQNLSLGRFSKPHWGQINRSLAPHSLQNFLVSGFSVWHFGHFICYPILGLKNGICEAVPILNQQSTTTELPKLLNGAILQNFLRGARPPWLSEDFLQGRSISFWCRLWPVFFENFTSRANQFFALFDNKVNLFCCRRPPVKDRCLRNQQFQ